MRNLFVALSAFAGLFGTSVATATDWIASPSFYTHNPQTGERVWQYEPIAPVYHYPSNSRSVYRQSRSSLQIGDSADHYHAVDRYGGPVRPYGEWRFPYRPFSVPYGLWGPQPAPGFGFGNPGFGAGNFGGVGSPYGPFGAVNGAGFPAPWNGGGYPDVRRRQLAPQPFNPTFNSTNNNINGNNNSPTTNANSPNNAVTGDNNNVTNN